MGRETDRLDAWMSHTNLSHVRAAQGAVERKPNPKPKKKEKGSRRFVFVWISGCDSVSSSKDGKGPTEVYEPTKPSPPAQVQCRRERLLCVKRMRLREGLARTLLLYRERLTYAEAGLPVSASVCVSSDQRKERESRWRESRFETANGIAERRSQSHKSWAWVRRDLRCALCDSALRISACLLHVGFG